jgi:methenyltetrahydromethanopterin cyclohydrolase
MPPPNASETRILCFRLNRVPSEFLAPAIGVVCGIEKTVAHIQQKPTVCLIGSCRMGIRVQTLLSLVIYLLNLFGISRYLFLQGRSTFSRSHAQATTRSKAKHDN